MKKILLSLAMVALVGGSAIAVTRAYFSNSQVLGTNTFTTGTVAIGGNVGFPMTVTGLAPGVEVVKDVQLGYLGTLNADLWMGASGTSTTDYMGNFVKVKIYNPDMGWIYDNYVSGLSGDWLKIASNIGTGKVNDYHIVFYIDSSFDDNTKQGLLNTDTVFKIYAVQTGGSKPINNPWPGVTLPF